MNENKENLKLGQQTKQTCFPKLCPGGQTQNMGANGWVFEPSDGLWSSRASSSPRGEWDGILSGRWTAIHVNCILSEINTCDKLSILVTGHKAKVYLCKCSQMTMQGKSQGRVVLDKYGVCKMSCHAGSGLPPRECLCSCPW